MADRVNIVKMAVDSYLGRPNGNYSVSETQACLRDQLIELNGGSTKLDPRSFRKHPELYEVIEEILTVTVNDGLQSDNPMYNFVEEHNVALGDSTEFVIEGNGEFVVSEVAVGTKGLRRQRLLGNTVLPVATKAYGAKIYDELQRVLAGKIDLNEMINRLGAAFTKKMNAEILKVTTDAFSQLTTPWQVTGTFDGDKLIDLIDHVEAATGQRATLLTSKQGARAMAKAFNFSAHDAQDEIFGLGYYTHLYDNPIVQENLAKLVRYGYKIITPDTGLLACGDVGRGKLAPVETIVDAANEVLQEGERPKDLAGKKVLVTAGPTQEAIDPVRYITNHSSGKMGYALAEAARDRGADVVLVSGQVALAPPSGVTVRKIVSAADMAEAVFAEFDETDVLIMAAAVADYRPKEVADQKIKKSGGGMTIELERTTDILGTLAEKKTHQFVCGFSMETENLIENSRKKLVKKKLDMIAANSIRDEGAGFAHDTNKVTVITKEDLCDLPLTSKAETAHLILDEIVKRI